MNTRLEEHFTQFSFRRTPSYQSPEDNGEELEITGSSGRTLISSCEKPWLLWHALSWFASHVGNGHVTTWSDVYGNVDMTHNLLQWYLVNFIKLLYSKVSSNMNKYCQIKVWQQWNTVRSICWISTPSTSSVKDNCFALPLPCSSCLPLFGAGLKPCRVNNDIQTHCLFK